LVKTTKQPILNISDKFLGYQRNDTMADNAETKQQVSFKDTLNLPHTDFPIRVNTKEEDPAMIERWIKEKLFEHSFTHNEGKKRFILHDGPPYANGHIHIGHAYNKILKDIVAKSKRMFGLQVPVTPGWDCHGLPIEFKVSQENKGLSPSELKKACRAYAQEWINVQREEFKKLGVLMDWDHPYLTMNYSYEAYTLKAFAQFVEEKYIERKNKTVPWCIHCETVLATAEIEYEDRKDPSIYVMFPLEQKIIDQQLPFLKDTQVSLLIWTTTPWTLPLNRAVLARPGIMYEILLINGKQVLVAQPLADKVTALMGVEKQVLGHIMSDQLVAGGARVHHPFIEGLTVPLILDESVLLDEGTAFVHCAPGAGPQDYDVAIKNNLDIFSPVSTNGHYMPGIMPAELEGMSLADAQGWVIKKLTEQDKLLFKTSIKHPYPHCWRCHNPLIFRATKQWFVDLEKHNIKKDTLLTIQENVAMYPAASKNRLMATIDGRLEWCLSRQRVWGTPIPALLCNNCDHTYISKELIERVAQGVEKAGIEYWDTVTIEDLVGKDVCPSCKKYDWKKEQDILDVWFDSGVSNYVVLKHNPALQFPADIYVEGKDQHRGWFQSSLLSSMALNHEACMRSIITHGFTVDANGRKMSKSLGNVVSPQEMIEKLGTDGLRCWAAGIDYAGDAVVSDVLMRNVQEVFRKVRNTCRFLLSNIYDFDIDRDVVPLEELRLIDQHAMLELFEINAQILSHYENYEFTKVFHGLGDYCTVNLSSFYLDIIKDRLYVESLQQVMNVVQRRLHAGTFSIH
jgi:isoleucyl-tRNA synthetase